MSNILKTKEDLIKLKEYIDLIRYGWLKKDNMEIIVDGILPKDSDGNRMVGSKVVEKGRRTAIYIPNFNTIEFSVDKCRDWVINNLEDLSKYYNVEDQKSFGYYLSLFIMLHEVEHSYQYLMGQGKIEAPCKLVQGGYKHLTELMIKPNDILPRPIKTTRRYISIVKYYQRQEEYALERNANVEAFSTILALAYESGNEEMIRVFTNLTRSYMSIGYLEDSEGVFYHTFKDILMMDKFKKINDTGDLNIDEKIRYGLAIPNYKRLEFLDKVKRRTV